MSFSYASEFLAKNIHFILFKLFDLIFTSNFVYTSQFVPFSGSFISVPFSGSLYQWFILKQLDNSTQFWVPLASNKFLANFTFRQCMYKLNEFRVVNKAKSCQESSPPSYVCYGFEISYDAHAISTRTTRMLPRRLYVPHFGQLLGYRLGTCYHLFCKQTKRA